MAAIVRARNELVRVAVKLDPPRTIGRPRRMSTVDTIQLIMWMCRAGDVRGVCYHVRTTCHIRPYIIVLIYGRGCESLTMHFIIWRSTKYRQHIQNPLIIDSTQVKNVYGVDVVDNTPTEVETLQKCLC